MFSASAEFYDKIYAKLKNYEKEAAGICTLIKDLRPNARSILDVACGTGEHDRYINVEYDVDGIDLNDGFIRIARSKNSKGSYTVADMIDFDLGRRYDVVLCLFSSIGYVQSIENLHKTIANFKRHLNDRGIIIVEPWFAPDAWKNGVLHLTTIDEDQLKICRMNISETTLERLSSFTFHYLVGTPNGVTHFFEDHALGLFTVEEMKAAFAASELAVHYDGQGISGRGLYVATKI